MSNVRDTLMCHCGGRGESHEDAPDSGVRASCVRRANPPPALDVALRYWPGRWPSEVVGTALSLEPHVDGEMTAEGWMRTLDAIAAAIL